VSEITYIISLFVYNIDMKKILLLLISVCLYSSEVKVEILGSGGPEIDNRASASYLVWKDNKAIALIDVGSGSMYNYEKSGAKLVDLEAILVSHLHIDHVVDLPSYIKAGYFTCRNQLLPIVGPSANHSFPSMHEFLELTFGEKGSYRYMSDVLTAQSDSFQLQAHSINAQSVQHLTFKNFTLDVINVHHGRVPALAFALHVDNKKIVFSGDTNNASSHLNTLLKDADLFIAHHAVCNSANSFAKELHMTPDIIANVAKEARVKKVVLSHRMLRTIGQEDKAKEKIEKRYKGELVFAEDRDIITLP